MALPNVNITLANGQLGGVLSTNDGIAGMVLTGATEGSVTQGTPFVVTGYDDFKSKGLTDTNNAFVIRQVKEFYDEAPVGTLLYLLLVPNTLKVNQMADKTNANGAVKLLDYAAGTIRLLGVMSDDNTVSPGAITNGINADCYTAIANMQTLGTEYFGKQTPFRGIVGGTSYTVANDAAITTQTGATNNRVALLIGDTASGSKAAALGLLLGRLAANPVQRKPSRVKSGALTATSAYVGAVDSKVYVGAATLHDKNIITFRTFPNKSGYYFTSGATCTSDLDDYQGIERGRVIDKAQIITYATFVEEVDDEVPVNTDGTLSAGYVAYLQQRIENQINLIMTANNEISSVACFIDPAQNVLSTATINVVLKIVPVGYASNIEVKLGFDNPALAA